MNCWPNYWYIRAQQTLKLKLNYFIYCTVDTCILLVEAPPSSPCSKINQMKIKSNGLLIVHNLLEVPHYYFFRETCNESIILRAFFLNIGRQKVMAFNTGNSLKVQKKLGFVSHCWYVKNWPISFTNICKSADNSAFQYEARDDQYLLPAYIFL